MPASLLLVFFLGVPLLFTPVGDSPVFLDADARETSMPSIEHHNPVGIEAIIPIADEAGASLMCVFTANGVFVPTRYARISNTLGEACYRYEFDDVVRMDRGDTLRIAAPFDCSVRIIYQPPLSERLRLLISRIASWKPLWMTMLMPFALFIFASCGLALAFESTRKP